MASQNNSPAPRLGGSALWFVSALLRAPLVGPALARYIGRDVVDGRLRHPDLATSEGGPAPLYAPPSPAAEPAPRPPHTDDASTRPAGGPVSW